jgi:mono/diheme cytochrome c family protein
MKRKIAFGVLIGGLAWAGISALAQNQKAQPTETTHLIASIRGPALYKAYCAVCHGTDGRGNGPMAKSLKVSVADLTRIAMRNGGTFPRMRMERIILGEDIPSGHGAREMPLWGPVFSQVTADQDLGRVRVDNLARFIEGMQIK